MERFGLSKSCVFVCVCVRLSVSDCDDCALCLNMRIEFVFGVKTIIWNNYFVSDGISDPLTENGDLFRKTMSGLENFRLALATVGHSSSC